jgi:hypothetical protein
VPKVDPQSVGLEHNTVGKMAPISGIEIRSLGRTACHQKQKFQQLCQHGNFRHPFFHSKTIGQIHASIQAKPSSPEKLIITNFSAIVRIS